MFAILFPDHLYQFGDFFSRDDQNNLMVQKIPLNGLISTKDTFDWLHICLNNKKNLYVQSGITGMIGMTGISGKLGISDIIIPRWYKSLPGPIIS